MYAKQKKRKKPTSVVWYTWILRESAIISEAQIHTHTSMELLTVDMLCAFNTIIIMLKCDLGDVISALGHCLLLYILLKWLDTTTGIPTT